MDWFPQQHSEQFFVLIASVAAVSTVLMVIHMSTAWSKITSRGQRWRYRSLLFCAILLAISGADLARQDNQVELRHLLWLIGALYILIAASISIHEDRRT